MASTSSQTAASSRPHSVDDSNNTAANGDPYQGSYNTCSNCVNALRAIIGEPGGRFLLNAYCAYNPSLRHYDLHKHLTF